MFPKLRFLFFLSIPLFVIHGIEEYVTGFPDVDTFFMIIFRPVMSLPLPQATFVVFQVMLWLLLILSALVLLGERWQRRLLIIPGIVYILEAHHLIEAIIRWTYYPGSLTAIFFPILAFFFWREYLFRAPHTG